MQRLAAAQGLYFLTTGLWPLVDLRSFMAVTGPKVDGWLVKTVGVLVAVIGGSLLLAAGRGRPTPETAVLALGSATGLAAVDLTYALRGRIARIYLLDALLQSVLIAAWLVLRGAWGSQGRGSEERRIWPFSSKASRTRPSGV